MAITQAKPSGPHGPTVSHSAMHRTASMHRMYQCTACINGLHSITLMHRTELRTAQHKSTTTQQLLISAIK